MAKGLDRHLGKATNNMLLQDFAVVVDMTAHSTSRREEGAWRLSHNLHIPSLHAVPCHVSSEGEDANCTPMTKVSRMQTEIQSNHDWDRQGLCLIGGQPVAVTCMDP